MKNIPDLKLKLLAVLLARQTGPSFLTLEELDAKLGDWLRMDCFYPHIKRTVRPNGTVRVNNRLYRVHWRLRTRVVGLRVNPAKAGHIEVFYQGIYFGLAKPLNVRLNSQNRPGSDYEKRP